MKKVEKPKMTTGNLRTTIGAVLGTVAWLAAKWGFDLSPQVLESITQITVLVVGLFAADAIRHKADQPRGGDE